MNFMRIAILGVAFIAAAAAVLLARGMLGGGGGTAVSKAAPPAVTTEVLVASKDIAPGHALEPNLVHWEVWPKTAVPPTGFIVKDATARHYKGGERDRRSRAARDRPADHGCEHRARRGQPAFLRRL